jgi:hypothetical protein
MRGDTRDVRKLSKLGRYIRLAGMIVSLGPEIPLRRIAENELSKVTRQNRTILYTKAGMPRGVLLAKNAEINFDHLSRHLPDGIGEQLGSLAALHAHPYAPSARAAKR